MKQYFKSIESKYILHCGSPRVLDDTINNNMYINYFRAHTQIIMTNIHNYKIIRAVIYKLNHSFRSTNTE